jgi:hypothetical protein
MATSPACVRAIRGRLEALAAVPRPKTQAREGVLTNDHHRQSPHPKEKAVLLGVDNIADFNGLHSRKQDDDVELYGFDVLMSAGDDLRPLPLHYGLSKCTVSRIVRSARLAQANNFNPMLFRMLSWLVLIAGAGGLITGYINLDRWPKDAEVIMFFLT